VRVAQSQRCAEGDALCACGVQVEASVETLLLEEVDESARNALQRQAAVGARLALTAAAENAEPLASQMERDGGAEHSEPLSFQAGRDSGLREGVAGGAGAARAAELARLRAELRAAEEAVERSESALAASQARFEAALGERLRLKDAADKGKAKLDLVTMLLLGLQEERRRWARESEKAPAPPCTRPGATSGGSGSLTFGSGG